MEHCDPVWFIELMQAIIHLLKYALYSVMQNYSPSNTVNVID